MNGRKFGKPRGKTCRWTPELDEVFRSAWLQGGLRAARRAIRENQPTWTVYSMRRRAAALSLCKPKAAPWSDADVNSMLWAIDSNASLALIADDLQSCSTFDFARWLSKFGRICKRPRQVSAVGADAPAEFAPAGRRFARLAISTA